MEVRMGESIEIRRKKGEHEHRDSPNQSTLGPGHLTGVPSLTDPLHSVSR